jgi:hypothetical protein
MTLQPSHRRAKPRWLTLIVLVAAMSMMGATLVLAHGIEDIPTRYAGGTQEDVDPPPGPAVNDVPGQVDMTQMGRDTSVNPDVRIFWSWDSINSWAGSGQTGDACALFDTDDTDANINYVVCARVQNTGAIPSPVVLLPASANHPAYLFDCSNKKNDRCTNPVPRAYDAGGVLAGPLTTADNTLTQTGAGDLVNETDPFEAGESSPHDTSIEIRVDDSLVPTGVRLANVCSYPSAGNGGNNNPFDCVVTPGVQYGILRVTKTIVNDNGGSKAFADFSFTAGSGASTTGVIGATAFDGDGIIDTQVPVGTYSVTEVGTPIAGYATSYSNCTSVSVTAGNTTTCAITNNDTITTPGIGTTMRWTLNDRATMTNWNTGGGASTMTFTLYRDAAGVALCDPSTQVHQETVSVVDASGTATTATGYGPTETTGTYRWVATFNGNSFNASTSTACTLEVTTLP